MGLSFNPDTTGLEPLPREGSTRVRRESDEHGAWFVVERFGGAWLAWRERSCHYDATEAFEAAERMSHDA